jgi:hypothetical protein
MGEGASVCEHCGAPLLADTFFCGACGKPVAQPQQPRSAMRKHTMLGGVPAVSVPPPKPEPIVPERERTTDVGISEPPAGQMGRTMLGLGKPAAGSAADPAQKGGGFAKTMLGMPAAELLEQAAKLQQQQRERQQRVAAQAQPGQPQKPAPAPHTRTLLGGPESMALAAAVAAADQKAAHAAASAPAANKPVDTSRTLLGLDAGAPAVGEAPAAKADKPDATTPAEPRRASDTGNAGRGSRPSTDRSSRSSRTSSDITVRRGPSYAVYALAALAVGAAAVFLYLSLRDRSPDVQVKVVNDGTSEAMVFEVPGASEGAKLRFGGQEKPVQAGRASFALGGDSLRVGKNAVLFDLVKADGDVESGRVTLSVDYRVTLDTAPLRAGKPAVDVVVAAVPGSKVWLDGQAVTLDAQGRAVRTDALDAAASSGRIEHVVKYRVQPPAAEATVGELHTSIPVTSMQIDRPGALVVTDRDAIEIAGAVDKDARVTIDDKPVQVVGDRFVYKYPLPKVGDAMPRIVAMADGKAPTSSTIVIQRVQDLAKAAAGFKPEPGLTYAKIAQNPAIYRGQRVAFEGRVYNVNVASGRSVLQVLVRECPDGQRCPLWVDYGSATDFTVGSVVRVLGMLQGEQQFRAESDEMRTVPKVDAVFLLPATGK